MTVQTALENLSSTLRLVANRAMSNATSLIDGGVSYLKDIDSDKVSPIDFDPTPAALEAAREFPPPKVRAVGSFDLADSPSLQKVNPIIPGPFSASLPSYTSPDFSYSDLDVNRAFTEEPDELGALPSIEDAPDITPSESVSLTAPEWVETALPEVDPGTAPATFELPGLPDLPFETLLRTQYQQLMSEHGEDWTVWARNLTRDVLFDDLVLDYLQGVFDGGNTAVRDTYESEQYKLLIQDMMEKYRAGVLESANLQSSGATGFPSSEMVTRWLDLELGVLNSALEAAEKVETERRKTEVAHNKWALSLAVALVGDGLTLRIKSGEQLIRGLLLGLQAASDYESLADALYDLKKKQFDLVEMHNSMLVRRLEALVGIEKLKVTKLRTDAANADNVVAYNRNVANDYDIAVKWCELRAALYEAAIDEVIITEDFRKIQIERQTLKASAVEVNARGAKIAVDLVRAKMAGDAAALGAETSKLAEFEAYVAEFSAKIRTELAVVQSQRADNKAKRAAWLAKLEAMIEYQDILNAATSTVAQGLLAQYDAEFDSAMVEVSEQDYANRKQLEEKRRAMQAQFTELREQIYAFSKLVNQRLAQGNVAIEGAATMGRIAEAAFGGMNAVGGNTAIEYA